MATQTLKFEEVEVPQNAGRKKKQENPFQPYIAHLLARREEGVQTGLVFDYAPLYIADDENETMERVRTRASKMARDMAIGMTENAVEKLTAKVSDGPRENTFVLSLMPRRKVNGGDDVPTEGSAK